MADEYAKPEIAPVSLRVEQSSVPVNSELAVPPEIVLETEASGLIARVVGAPTVTSVMERGPLAGRVLAGSGSASASAEELHAYVPEYVPALQSAS
jgi:hypothetical protein